MAEEKVEARNVSLYPRHWEAVEQIAREYEGNVSLALRRIVNEWMKRKQLAKSSKKSSLTNGGID